MAQFQIDKSQDADPQQRADVLYGLSEEHPDHPGGAKELQSTDPVED